LGSGRECWVRIAPGCIGCMTSWRMRRVVLSTCRRAGVRRNCALHHPGSGRDHRARPFPVNERDERRVSQEESRRVDRTVEELREAIACKCEEPVTQDLYIEIAGAIEKQRW